MARRCPWRGRPCRGRCATCTTRESDLLRVNGVVLNMQTVMGYLDGIWTDVRLLEALVDGCLIREAVDASSGEVRRAVAAFERTRGLTVPSEKEVRGIDRVAVGRSRARRAAGGMFSGVR